MVSPNVVRKIPIAIGIKPDQPTTFTNKTLDFGSSTGNIISNVPTAALQYNTISINNVPVQLGTNINLQVEGGDPIINTDTTYSFSTTSESLGANLNLNAGGSGSGTDSVLFKGGGNVAVTRLADGNILISDGGALGGVSVTNESTTTLTNKTLDFAPGTGNSASNIPNDALVNNYITINNENIALGGNVTIAGGGGGQGDPNAIETFTNKTISGSNNTLENIGNSSLSNSSITINGEIVSLGGSLTVSGLGNVTTTGEQDLSNKSLIAPILSDAKIVAGLYLGAGSGVTGNAGQVAKSTGTGVEWADEDRTLAIPLGFGAGISSSSGDSDFSGDNGTTISVDTSIIASLTGQQTLSNKTLEDPNLTGDLQIDGVSGANGETIVSDGNGGLTWGQSSGGGGGSFNGPASSTDDAILRYDGTTGALAQNSLVTISDTGAITAPQASSVIPFYYDSTFGFPDASDYHGAIAHSHTDGAMYFAHGDIWNRLANTSEVTLQSRFTVSEPTGSIDGDGTGTDYPTITNAAKSYLLYKLQVNRAAWVRVYTSTAARGADSGRSIDEDPSPGSGVIAEVITTGADTVVFTPAVLGFNDESTPVDSIYLAVTNMSSSAGTVTTTLTILKTEI